MVIFHSYVSLPEGTFLIIHSCRANDHPMISSIGFDPCVQATIRVGCHGQSRVFEVNSLLGVHNSAVLTIDQPSRVKRGMLEDLLMNMLSQL